LRWAWQWQRRGGAAGAQQKFISTAAPDCGCGCIYCTRCMCAPCFSLHIFLYFSLFLRFPFKTLPHEYIENIYIYRKWLPTAAPTKVGGMGRPRLLQRSFTPVPATVNVSESESESQSVYVRICIWACVWPKVSTLPFYNRSHSREPQLR